MPTSITAALGGGHERLNRAERKFGIVRAVVTNTKDPEQLGRVKLKFPGLSENNESDWTPVASFIAGKDRGAFFPYEVEDEVLVAFLHGDIDHPVVIGAIWGEVDKPPEKNADGKSNIKLIKSRAGHTITINDDDQKAQIEIKTKAGHTITMDDAKNKEKLEIKSKSGNTITMNDAPGQEKIDIKDKSGQNKITMDANQKTVEINSGMTLNIKAKIINIEANGQLNLKGGLVNIGQ